MRIHHLKFMKHQESSSAIKFRHWLRANPFRTCAIENKDSRGKDYLNFSEVKEAQLNYGLAISGDKGVLIRTEGVEGLPDYIYMRGEPSFIVIKYPKSIQIISVETFILEKQKSRRKSLTEQRASEISIKSIKL